MLARRDFSLERLPGEYGYKTYHALYSELAKDPKKWKKVNIGNGYFSYNGNITLYGLKKEKRSENHSPFLREW